MKELILIIGLLLLTGCTSAPKSPDLGEVHVTVAERIGENSAAHNIQEGLFHLQKGDLHAAQDQFNLALQKDAMNSYFHYLSGLCYHLRMLDGEAEQRDLAEHGYQYAIALDPTNWLASYQLALFYQDIRQWQDAAQTWRRTLEFRSEDSEAHRNAIYSAYYARNLPMARELLETYAVLEQDRDRYNELASIVLAASGEEAAARQSLQKLPDRSQNRLSVRVRDWTELHAQAQKRFSETREDESLEVVDGEHDRDKEDESSQTESEPIRALAVDVVIIRTTEEIGSTRGINILKELQLTLGNQDEPGFLKSNTRETNSSDNTFIDPEGDVIWSGRNIDFQESDVISRAISIPAINYSLNIANVTGARNEVLARPTLIAQDGEQSSFFSGSHINAVAVGGSNSDGATESIDVDVGVLLSIGAEFHSDNEFTLNVEAERTFLQEPNTSAVTFPLFVSYSKTRAEATIRMKFGQSLILSGLSEKETARLRDGVPVLGDIPVVQYLFNRRATRDFQSSVVLLITPHPPQYVYSDDDGVEPLSSLQGVFGSHWQPYPNITQVFQHMESNRLFREFRTGDVRVEKWLSQESFSHRLLEVQRFVLDLQ